MKKLHSEGVCVYCSQTFKKAGISRHLQTHLKELAAGKTSTKKAFHLRVEADIFFLNLLVDGAQPLEKLDYFLRNIWLECCGHLSSFEKKGKHYDMDWSDDFADPGEPKSKKMEKVFQEGDVFDYQYDFGSTTELTIKVLGAYKMEVKNGVELLSRNEPIHFLCQKCKKKPALEICSVHVWEGEAMFCEDCAEMHAEECPDFEDYAAMPVVNSPRMGVCAYEGGSIDTARDEAWEG